MNAEDLLPLSAFPDEGELFGVVITARCRHGDLWAAARRLGGQSALARTLGVSPTTAGAWVNLKDAPTDRHPRRRELEDGLLLLTGKSWDELWPPELRDAIKGGAVAKQLELRREVRLRDMAALTDLRNTAPDPEAEAIGAERRRQLERCLCCLPPRLRGVLSLRHGLGSAKTHTLEEIAGEYRITRERVRQLILRAEAKVREYVLALAPELVCDP